MIATTETLNSPASRDRYLAIWQGFDRDLTAAGIQSYVAERRDSGYAPSTVNLHLAALKHLARQKAAVEELPRIEAIKSIPVRGVRMGTWLSLEQIRQLLELPSGAQLREIRDRALLSVLVGSAVRRAELTSLKVSHLAVLDGRTCISDLIGKGLRVRTVPLPSFTVQHLAEWMDAGGIREGFLWRRVLGRTVMEESIGPDHVHCIVGKSAKRLVIQRLSPHDLRRSFAQQARRGKADLEQISTTLGHANLVTTQRYLGISLDLENPACDAIRL